MNRTCSRCKSAKPLEDFPTTGRPNEANLGHEGVCRACVKAREAGETRRCKSCRKVLPADAFRIYKGDRREHHCRACRAAFYRDRRAQPALLREPRRKLPDYDTLKGMLLDKQMSYAEIAVEYGVKWPSVQRSIRAKAIRRGEWPLLSEAQVRERIIRGRRKSRIPGKYRVNTFALAEAIRDYMAEHELTMAQFAQIAGLTDGYVRSIAGSSKKVVDTTAPAYAVRILEVCGETISTDLRRLAKRGPQPGPLPTRQAQADVKACATPSSAPPDVAERVG